MRSVFRSALAAGAILFLGHSASAQVVDYERDRAGNVTAIRSGDEQTLAPRAQWVRPYGNVGDTLRLTGFGLAGAQQATFGTAASTAQSASDRSAEFVLPTGARSGIASLSVDGESSQVAEPFLVLPSTIPASQVSGVATGGQVNLVADYWTLFPVDSGSLGLLNVLTQSLSQSLQTPIDYRLVDPSGVIKASGVLAGAGGKTALPTMEANATYVLALKASAWSRVGLSFATDPMLIKDGDYQTVTGTASGQTQRLGFELTQGDRFSLGFSNVATTPSKQYVYFDVYRPDGTFATRAQCGSTSAQNYCNVRYRGAEQTGLYTVVAYAPNAGTSYFTSRVWLTSENLASLTADVALDYQLDRPGEIGTLSFEGAAGESLTLGVQTMTKYLGGGAFRFTFRNPDGSCLHSGCTVIQSVGRTHTELPVLTQSGTHTIRVDVWDDGKTSSAISAPITLSRERQLENLTIDGSALTFSEPVYGRRSWIEFEGTAGETLTVGANATTSTPYKSQIQFEIYRPDGALLRTARCASNYALNLCDAPLWDLAQSGTYRMRIRAADAAANSFGAALWLSRHVDLDLPLGETRTLALTRPSSVGKVHVELLPGQTRRLVASAFSSVPNNQGYYVLIVKPDGGCLVNGCPWISLHVAATNYTFPSVTEGGIYHLYFEMANNGYNSTTSSVNLRLENLP